MHTCRTETLCVGPQLRRGRAYPECEPNVRVCVGGSAGGAWITTRLLTASESESNEEGERRNWNRNWISISSSNSMLRRGATDGLAIVESERV